ncbi:hypothetical protein AMAG_08780 [Allomyces macrogynus ATCC 38327]|uniref:Letm1 RBD domain-containing protein n=1 Tax=Allomyces macrogynus (strain ATCC 38327) TaxID=578462 RepID=A0A0L0SMS9_ALLM3|nr:hypothetical protein AMAG_08780 [Allomyces macrogynus ATCC 38327]|eukprot:KNE63684.1 hypothetical protein AMAG_08780 [Allomyces macrogynus ATCC 38327]
MNLARPATARAAFSLVRCTSNVSNMVVLCRSTPTMKMGAPSVAGTRMLATKAGKRSKSAVAATPVAKAAPAPTSATTDPTATTTTTPATTDSITTTTVASANADKVPARSTPAPVAKPAADARKKSFGDKMRDFFHKYKRGLTVLLREDLPAYRALQSTKPDPTTWTWRETQLARRVRSDLRILAPFGFFLLFLPEVIPLLVLRGLVPSTCLDAEDIQKQRAKLAAKRLETAGKVWSAVAKAPVIKPASLTTASAVASVARRFPTDFDVHHLAWSQMVYSARYFEQFPYLPSTRLLHSRLVRRMRELEADDRLLLRDAGGVQGLTDAELAAAAEARGVATEAVGSATGKKPTRRHLEAMVESWIEMNTDATVPKPLVVFARIVQMEHLRRALDRTSE